MGVECRLLPHGGYALLPAVISTVAWVCSLVQDGCDYARLSGPFVPEMTLTDTLPFVEVGFNAYREPYYDLARSKWEIQYGAPCLAYDESVVDIDTFWKLAKGFQFVSLVFGGGGALFLWFSTCFVFSPATWRWAGYEVLIASVFQTLAFLWFRTSVCQAEGNECSMFFGAKSDIVAAVFWFTSAVMIFSRYPPPKLKQEEGGRRPTRDIEVAETIAPDGRTLTHTMEEATESPDGQDHVSSTDVPIEGDAEATISPEEEADTTDLDPNVRVPGAEIS